MKQISSLILDVLLLVPLVAAPFHTAQALDYPYTTAEPQKTGWPLTEEEKKYVLIPEHERRPGAEQKKHLPAMWPVTPSAGNWGGTSWLDMHAKLVKDAEASKGPIDVLLVGDSITMQWGAAWTKHFPTLKTVNIGIGGDKTQNVLWRLDHGGVAGLEPRLVIVLIGNNNMFFTAETGIEAAAKGIQMVVANVREKFPNAPVLAVKIFPAHAPGNRFYQDIKKTNAALDALKLDSDPKVTMLDLWNDMVNADGTLKKELFMPDNIHLTQDGGYALYASKLKPLVEKLLGNTRCGPPTDPICGVGLALGKVGQDFVIKKIFPDSPAAAQREIIVGDRILAVAQGNEPAVSVKNLELAAVIASIRGSVGSTVRLTIAHPGEADSRARTVSLIRKLLSFSNLVPPKGSVPTLKPGDVAPKLSVGAWVQGEPVSELEKDKAYLVEFWATWCGPCVTSIPHLNEIANKFKDKGLVVIGQNVWEEDASKVKPFVEKMSGQMMYRVALDGKGTMAETWLKAAGKTGIPCAFLVGKDGKIAWIGHPGELSDRMIESVLEKEAASNRASAVAGNVVLNSKPVLTYPYAPYNEGKMDPQLAGWPLTAAEKAWVTKEEYFRKPGHEAQKHLPTMWAITPTAAHWQPKDGGTGNLWIEHHATIIKNVQASKGHMGIALIGDSITQGWGGGWDGAPFNAAWQKHFTGCKTVNLGIGGDRTENVLWRLDHGALDGASPKVIVLMIGVNNAPLVTANGMPASVVAQGIKLCVDNLRARCPKAQIVTVRILPAFAPGSAAHEDIKRINAALDGLKLDSDPQVHILDLWSDFTNADGTLKTALYSDGHLHLGPTGYETFATKLKPIVMKHLR